MSNQTSLHLYWDKVADEDIATSGYHLEMAEGDSQEFTVVYDGQNLPQGTDFLVDNLTTGSELAFRLYALNYNGRSEASDIFKFNVCTVPKGMMPPYKIRSEPNEIVIGWSDPLDNGGCPITGYAIFRDDAQGSDVTIEVNEDDDPNIRNDPVLKQATITSFPTDTVGSFFRFKMRVFNREGSSESALITLLNAGPPDAPTQTVELLEQTATFLRVSMPLIADENNGGSQIISYNLQIDDANGGPFVNVGGVDPISMRTEYTLGSEYVTRGQTYRLRYRVKNDVDIYSWSDYSDVLYALVSDTPSPP